MPLAREGPLLRTVIVKVRFPVPEPATAGSTDSALLTSKSTDRTIEVSIVELSLEESESDSFKALTLA